jgi:hypothetical protein
MAYGPEGVDTGVATFWVADAWDQPGNELVDPIYYQEEFGLPVLHLERPEEINQNDELPSTMVYRGVSYDIEVKYRGAASLYYPKNSYTIYLPPDGEFEDPKIDFPKRRAIVLTTLFDDNSYMRQKMVYDLWNMLDDSRHRIETRFVVVYINGEYEGLYILGDHIDGEYWEDNGHYEDGNLYKSVDHSANFATTFNGATKTTLASGYEKKEGYPEQDQEGAFEDLIELIDWVNTASDTDFQEELGEKVALNEFMDWWVLVWFVDGADSAGKNAYLYNDPGAPCWHFAPWDFNHSLGQTWQTDRVSVYEDNDFRTYNYLFYRMLTLPQTSEAMISRYKAALNGPYAPASTQALMDGYMAEIGPSAARDWEKWRSDYRSYSGWSWRDNWTEHTEEVDYLREWLNARQEFMLGLYP